MSTNNNISLLDAPQMIRRSFDPTNDAIRVSLDGVSIQLDSASGDSILAIGTEDGTTGGTQHALKVSTSGVLFIRADSISAASAVLTDASSGSAIAGTSCSGIKTFQLYAKAVTATTGALTVRIDVSPDGTNYFQTATTLTLPASLINTVVASSLLTTVIGQLVKVTITSNALGAAEQAQVFLVGAST